MSTGKSFLILALVLVQGVAHGDAPKIMDHAVVLDAEGRLQPWTTYDGLIRQSMNFIKNCPREKTRHGEDPWYLITSKLTDKGGFFRNQNNQGSNCYYAVETLRRYYPYSGDDAAFIPVRTLLDRTLLYCTPENWAWAKVPRTQDNSPDGAYTDRYSEPDKIAMVGVACVRFYKMSGETKYLEAALQIADALASHLVPGDADHSPLPFRVDLLTGEVLDAYTSFMVAPTALFDDLIALGWTKYAPCRQTTWDWVLRFPFQNNRWSGYYEDVESNPENCNQQAPLETARFMMDHPELSPTYKKDVPALITFVRDRFGKNKVYGATSICEQDSFMKRMSSHTARYASVVARWAAIARDAALREEARASFALSTYSACSQFSRDGNAINYVGIDYIEPWFSDSYFDYLCHLLDGMATLPEMIPNEGDHLIFTNGYVSSILYQARRIDYETYEDTGEELFRLTFAPKVFAEKKKPLPPDDWHVGKRGENDYLLRISRHGVRRVRILADISN